MDLDVEIENVSGLQVPELFLKHGEAGFRKIERELTQQLASASNLVLAPGGGWAMHNTLPGAFVVWLRVDPREAVARLGENAANRPLLEPDPLAKMKELLAHREQYYAKADLAIETDGRKPVDIAEEIVTAIGK